MRFKMTFFTWEAFLEVENCILLGLLTSKYNFLGDSSAVSAATVIPFRRIPFSRKPLEWKVLLGPGVILDGIVLVDGIPSHMPS